MTNIGAINSLPGPLVKFIDKRIGYGLFADRDYAKGEFVTKYGGIRVCKEIYGSYVIHISGRNLSIDAEYVFKLSEKGRWINETSEKKRNVKLCYEKGELVFRVTNRGEVKAGEEFLWYYGDEFIRPYDL